MTHRFYVGETKSRAGELKLTHELWVNDQELTNQVLRVLRMRANDELVLFDGQGKETLYKITDVEERAFHVEKVTDIEPKNPNRKIILAWSLLKKDKNEWVLQKCTELGVTHFLPLITDRTEKTGFDSERAHKIVVEAVEQSGRHTIPHINEPQSIASVIGQYKDHIKICVADMAGDTYQDAGDDEVLVLIGPEGGWSDTERLLFAEQKIPHIAISSFVLRAETACISAISLLAGQ